MDPWKLSGRLRIGCTAAFDLGSLCGGRLFRIAPHPRDRRAHCFGSAERRRDEARDRTGRQDGAGWYRNRLVRRGRLHARAGGVALRGEGARFNNVHRYFDVADGRGNAGRLCPGTKSGESEPGRGAQIRVKQESRDRAVARSREVREDLWHRRSRLCCRHRHKVEVL